MRLILCIILAVLLPLHALGQQQYTEPVKKDVPIWAGFDRTLGEDYFANLAARNPDNAEYQFLFASSIQFYRGWDEAEDVLKRVIELDPQHKRAFATLMILHLRRGEYQSALDYFLRYDNFSGRKNRSVFHQVHDMGRFISGFSSKYMKGNTEPTIIYALEPYNTRNIYNLSYHFREDLPVFKKYFEEALDEGLAPILLPSQNAYDDFRKNILKSASTDEKEKFYKEQIERFPHSPSLYYNYSYIKSNNGENEEALALMKVSVSLLKDSRLTAYHFHYHSRYRTLLYEAGQFDELFNILEDVVTTKELTSNEANQFSNFVVIGDHKRDKQQLMISILENVPNYAFANVYYAYQLEKDGEPDLAQKYYINALKHDLRVLSDHYLGWDRRLLHIFLPDEIEEAMAAFIERNFEHVYSNLMDEKYYYELSNEEGSSERRAWFAGLTFPERAKMLLRDKIKQDPSYITSYLDLAEILKREKNLEEEQLILKQGLQNIQKGEIFNSRFLPTLLDGKTKGEKIEAFGTIMSDYKPDLDTFEAYYMELLNFEDYYMKLTIFDRNSRGRGRIGFNSYRLHELEYPQELDTALLQASKLFPNNNWVFSQLIILRQKQGASDKEIYDYYIPAQARLQDNWYFQRKLFSISINMARLENIDDIFIRLLKTTKNPDYGMGTITKEELFYKLAQVIFVLDDQEKVERIFEIARELKFRQYILDAAYGMYLDRIGDYDDAQRYLTKAYDGNYSIRKLVAELNSKLDNYGEAVEFRNMTGELEKKLVEIGRQT